MLCGSLDGRGVWERMDTCICMAESLSCSPETITLLIRYTPIQNSLKKKKNSCYYKMQLKFVSLGVTNGCNLPRQVFRSTREDAKVAPQAILAKSGRESSRPSPSEKAQKLLVLEPSFLKLGLCKS